MSFKTNFIVFDGMDDCGKSTLIKSLRERYRSRVREIKFPKTLPSGALLRINTEKDFELLFSMFELLDPDRVYLLDRFIVSNLVYDKVLRNEDTSLSSAYHQRFLKQFNVLEIFLTRPFIHCDFVDDRIKLTYEQFNAGLYEYHLYGKNYQILNRDSDDRATHPTHQLQTVMKLCDDFIVRHTE